jgi:diacylglycerol kinase family enzyme
MPIPAILNRRAGTADALRDAIAADARFALVEVEPGEVGAAVAGALRDGARRVAVAGGDGTITTAAAELLSHPDAEMAVLPGGTLNHFAVHLGVPTEPSAALDVAAGGEARRVDVAFVGDRLFVNTSSVGAYVTFVRLRERLERHLPYWLASLLAGLVLFFRLPTYRVEVEVEGTARRYDAPLVFVGVGERELRTPSFAELVANGRPGLHVIVVRGRRRARLLALGLAAARGGPRAVARMPEVDSFVVERCRVSVPRRAARVSADGEVQRMDAPLDYRVERGRLLVVAPPQATGREERGG